MRTPAVLFSPVVLDSLYDSLLLLDGKGRILYGNGPAEQAFGPSQFWDARLLPLLDDQLGLPSVFDGQDVAPLQGRSLTLGDSHFLIKAAFAGPYLVLVLHPCSVAVSAPRSTQGTDAPESEAASHEAASHDTEPCQTGQGRLDAILTACSVKIVRRTLEQCEGNKIAAAEVLGISRATLYRILASAKGLNI